MVEDLVSRVACVAGIVLDDSRVDPIVSHTSAWRHWVHNVPTPAPSFDTTQRRG